MEQPDLAVRLLGGLSIDVRGTAVAPPPTRAHALLGLLLLEPRTHPRARLAERLRPDLPVGTGRQRINSLLWLIRRSLPHLPLQVDDDAVSLPAATRWLDVEQFRSDAAAGDLATRRAALDRYRDRLLPAVDAPWVTTEREALHSEYVALAREVAEALGGAEQHDHRLAVLQRLCEHEQVDEEPLRLLIAAAAAAGRPTVGLKAFERHEQRLVAVGLQPERRTIEELEALRGPFGPAPAGGHRPGGRPSPGEDAVLFARGHGAPGGREVDAARHAVAVGALDDADGLLAAAGTSPAAVLRARLARDDGRLDDADAHLAQLDDVDGEAHVAALAERARLASHRGDGHLAQALAGQAAEEAALRGWPALRCRADIAAGAEHLRVGRLASALVALRTAWEAASRLDEPALLAECARLVAEAEISRGAPDEAALALDRADRAAREGGRADLLVAAEPTRALLARRCGAHAAARTHLTRALRTSVPGRRPPDGRRAWVAVAQLGVALDERDGDVAEALMLRDPAVQRACAGDPALAPRLLALQGAMHQRVARHDEALDALRRSARAHRRRGERHLAALADASAVTSLLARGAADAARRASRGAAELLHAGLLPADLEPQVRWACAAVARADGAVEEAVQQEAAAVGRLQAIAARVPAGADAERVGMRDGVARALARPDVHAAVLPIAG